MPHKSTEFSHLAFTAPLFIPENQMNLYDSTCMLIMLLHDYVALWHALHAA